MYRESLIFFLSLLVLMLIGIGPAIWFVRPGPKRPQYALCIAPALGYSFVAILGFPLARHLAPVRDWAFPITLLLCLLSVLLCIWHDRRNRMEWITVLRSKSLLPVGFILMIWSILISPVLLKGIQYSAFRNNPSDAFSYMSLAETLRVVRWSTLSGGVELTEANRNGLAQLAEASPTALFTARFLKIPIALNKPAMLAWLAEITHTPVYLYYFTHHLLAFALAVPLALVIGDLLRVHRALKYLGAASIVLGFWARFVLDSDAGYEISTMPLVLLVAFAWVEWEQEPLAWRANRLLLPIGATAMATFYFSVAGVVTIAFLGYYLLGVVQRTRSFQALLWHSATLLIVVVLLTITGQVDYWVQTSFGLVLRADAERIFSPTVINLIASEGSAAFWGMPTSVLTATLPDRTHQLLHEVLVSGGALLTIAMIVTAYFIVRDAVASERRIILALVGAGLTMMLICMINKNSRAAGKAFTYIYPYLILIVLVFPNYASVFLSPLAARVPVILVAGWLVTQSVFGLLSPLSNRASDALSRTQNGQAVSRLLKANKVYDLSSITDYLDSHPPKRLLVAIPRDREWVVSVEETWPFAYYTMFVFSKYPAYFQSGIIVDNWISTPNMWFSNLTEIPDYAIISKDVDYIGLHKLGSIVAESPNLALYHLNPTTQNTINLFTEQENILKEAENK